MKSKFSVDVPKPIAEKSLSNDLATKTLVDTAETILAEHEKSLPSWKSWCAKFLVKKEFYLVFFVGIVFLVYYILNIATLNDNQWRGRSSLGDFIVVLVLYILNGIAYCREGQLESHEVLYRAKEIFTLVKRLKMALHPSNARIPNSNPSITISRVVRGGELLLYPSVLLVKGDIVAMSYGDIAPASMVHIPLSVSESLPGSKRESADSRITSPLVLNAQEVLKPELVAKAENTKNTAQHYGHHFYQLLETPLELALRTSLSSKRPNSVLQNQLVYFRKQIYPYVVVILLAASLAINLIRYIVNTSLNGSQVANSGFEIIAVQAAVIMLPLLPLYMYFVLLLVKTYGNAKLLNLLHDLQSSKTEYEDAGDIDEFDAAPPPTKDIKLDHVKLLKRFFHLLLQPGDVRALTRSCALLETLGDVSVICSIDKEGTLFKANPSVEKLFFLSERGEPICLDVDEDDVSPFGIRFEDKDWRHYMPQLKPLGLNFMLNSDCRHQQKPKTESHRKISALNMHARCQSARQTCQCRVARTVGFNEKVALSFHERRTIYTFAPLMEILKGPALVSAYHYETPSMTSQIYQNITSGDFQLFSDGNLVLLLECCLDYWNGHSLEPLTDSIEKKILDIYTTSLMNDYQVVAYGYRPIQTAESLPFLLETPHLPTTHLAIPSGKDNGVHMSSHGVIYVELACQGAEAIEEPIVPAEKTSVLETVPESLAQGTDLGEQILFSKQTTSMPRSETSSKFDGLVQEQERANLQISLKKQAQITLASKADQEMAQVDAYDERFATAVTDPGSLSDASPEQESTLGLPSLQKDTVPDTSRDNLGHSADSFMTMNEPVTDTFHKNLLESTDAYSLARGTITDTARKNLLESTDAYSLARGTITDTVHKALLQNTDAYSLARGTITDTARKNLLESTDAYSLARGTITDTVHKALVQNTDAYSLARGTITDTARKNLLESTDAYSLVPVNTNTGNAPLASGYVAGQEDTLKKGQANEPAHNGASDEPGAPESEIYSDSFSEEEQVQKQKNPLEILKTKRSNVSNRFFSALDRLEPTTDESHDLANEESGQFYLEVAKGQSFLALGTFAFQVKPNVVDFIEDLGLAAIRFVYFSPAPERESKAAAERLGLATSWNSCILLSPPNEDSFGYMEMHDIKARLPRGLGEVRRHLENVDDIPLHVNLFAECSKTDVSGMTDVFGTYGDVCIVLGSCLQLNNVKCFATCDLSISIDPLPHFNLRLPSLAHVSEHSADKKARFWPWLAGSHETKPVNVDSMETGAQSDTIGSLYPVAVAAAILSLPASVHMQYETSLFTVTQLIKEARSLMQNIRLALLFGLGLHLAVAVLLLLSFALLLPPVLTGYQVVFFCALIVPVIGWPILLAVPDVKVMTTATVRNTDYLVDKKRIFVAYFFLRFGPLVVIALLVYILSFGNLIKAVRGGDLDLRYVFGLYDDGKPDSWEQFDSSTQSALLYAQNITIWCFVYCTSLISITFQHRLQPTWQKMPAFNYQTLVVQFIAAVGLQTAFFAVSVSSVSAVSLADLPWYVYVIILTAPIYLVPLQELCKKNDRKHWTQFQKRRKLEFNTKLGMHSPI